MSLEWTHLFRPIQPLNWGPSEKAVGKCGYAGTGSVEIISQSGDGAESVTPCEGLIYHLDLGSHSRPTK